STFLFSFASSSRDARGVWHRTCEYQGCALRMRLEFQREVPLHARGNETTVVLRLSHAARYTKGKGLCDRRACARGGWLAMPGLLRRRQRDGHSAIAAATVGQATPLSRADGQRASTPARNFLCWGARTGGAAGEYLDWRSLVAPRPARVAPP